MMEKLVYRRRKNKKSGAAAVEFALVLPILLVITVGTIEFGLLLYNQQVITNASREGARAGIIAQNPRATDDEIGLIVTTYTMNHLMTFGAANEPVTNVTRTGYAFGDDLTVTVTYQYSFLVVPGFIPGITKINTLTARTVMRYE